MGVPDHTPVTLSIRLLGPFEVQIDGRPLSRLRFRKSQAVLAGLALRGGAAVERDALAALLWPEKAPGAARHSLRNCLTDLRAALGPQVARLRSPTPRTLVLDLTGAFVDVVVFDAALARGDPESLETAVELYRGPLLQGSAAEWLFQEQQEREQAYLAARERLAELAAARGDAASAERHLRLAVAADPLRESAQRALMRLLAANGQYAGALLCYRELRQRLHRELNAAPDPQTQALFEALRARAREKAGGRPPVTAAALHEREAGDRGSGRPSGSGDREAGAASVSPGAAPRGPGAGPGGENRLVTVLAAGLSPPWAPGRAGPAGLALPLAEAAALVHRLLEGMVAAVREFGGQVDRFTGHGLLAIFGTPQAHEDDPERAIRAALEIRAAARSLALEAAVAVSTGEVYLAGSAAAGAGPGGAPGTGPPLTAAGPVVSFATWLQGQAVPGQILVGEAAYRQTRRTFEFSFGCREVNGRALPVRVYAAERAQARPEKARGIEGRRTELIGRDQELAALTAVIAAVAAGQGQMVSITGEAGVGKSRLVAELRQGVEPEGLDLAPDTLRPLPLWLEGRCLERSAATGYSAFVDLFRDYFVLTGDAGAWPEADERARGRRLAGALDQFRARGALTAAQVEEMAPVLGRLLAARFDSDQDQRLQHATPAQIQYQTFVAVREFLVALARAQPLLLVLDDLHWADDLSLGLLALLMEALPLAPIGLLCIYRTEGEVPRAADPQGPAGIGPWSRTGPRGCAHLAAIADGKCPERFREIRLRALTADQSGQLLVSLLQNAAMPAAVRRQVLSSGRGNPFFLEELVRAWLEAPPADPAAGEPGGAEPVPVSIRSVIVSRFDRLRPDLRPLLEYAAVIGPVFQPRLLEAVMTSALTDPSPLAIALWELEEQGLIFQERVLPEVEYSFKHVLVQQTIYQWLPHPERAERHRRVAAALEALCAQNLPERYESLAYHYERGTDDAKAVEYLLKAGEKARQAYLNEEAIGCFRRALARLEGRTGRRGDDRAATVRERKRGEREHGAAGSPRGPAHLRLEAARGLGAVYQGMGKHAEAAEQFRQAVALGEELRLPPGELAGLLFSLGDTLSWQGRADEMIEPAEAMLARLSEESESVEAALMNQMAGLGHRWRGDRETGLAYIHRNARFLERLPYSEPLRVAYYSVLAAYSMEEDDLDAATRWVRSFERQARQHHDLRALAGVQESRSAMRRLRGDLRGAIPSLQEALATYRRIGGFAHQALCCHAMRELFLSLGCLEEAAAYADQERQAAEAGGGGRSVAVALKGIAKVCGCRGDWDRALAVLQQTAEVSVDDPLMLAWIAYSRGRASLARGRRAEALEQFLEATTAPRPEPVLFVNVLSGLEEAYDDPAAFAAFCRRFRAQQPDTGDSPLVVWHLEPAEPDSPWTSRSFSGMDRISVIPLLRPYPVHPWECRRASRSDSLPTLHPSGWIWHDLYGDCSFSTDDGLEIRAANGRDLWHPDQSAPRLLCPVTGDFALQAVCRSVSPATPAIGGLLLWADKQQYLRLDCGTRGPHQITLGGCLPAAQPAPRGWWGQKNRILGRGRLVAERTVLRLERRGPIVRALCCAEGGPWFTVGQVPFPAADPLHVGVYALGTIHRSIYPGAYPEGTAIRFDAVDLWA